MVASRIYRAEVLHHRIGKPEHRFRYHLPTYAFDVDELETVSKTCPWMGYNRWRPLAVLSRDYLDGSDDSLRAKLQRLLKQSGEVPPLDRIVLVTGARFMGYVFNPVSFWFCYSHQTLVCLVAEVNNTFGERHTYILRDSLPCSSQFAACYRTEKAFYVSPFNAVEGDYEFRVAHPGDQLDIRLRVFRDHHQVFNTWMRASHSQTLTFLNLLRQTPWSTWLTLPRIHWEAAVLYFKKKLPIEYKPRPSSPWTIRAEPPSALHRLVINRVHEFLARSQMGELHWDLPNGQVLVFGQARPGVCARVRVLNWDFYLRLAWDGDVALGDGLLAGEWESADQTAVIRFFIDNRELLDDRKLWVTRWLGRAWGWLRQRQRANTLKGSKANIQAHYDLGNDLYRHFLDPSMSYSCAFYADANCDLAAAQGHKVGMLLDKAHLNAECHLLEIGCGWGSLAIEAARRFGCRVTGVTLSQQQWEWSRAKVAEAGLQDRIEILLCDYRKLEGRYDRVISCEMLEAVGHENYPDFFACLERLLSPQGLVVLQAITVPDFSYDEYRRSQDWIQKEIFPGALCPSLSALLEAARKRSQLVVEHLENIGPHYARTLREWRQRFLENWEKLQSFGYDERFRRAWCYYLSYCEAAFASRNLQDIQLVMTRPKNATLCGSDPVWLGGSR